MTDRQEPSEVERALLRLAIALHAKHYSPVKQWQPLEGDAIGLITQIDNMTATLVRPAAADQAVYRFLDHGELIEAGDECPSDNCERWEPVNRWAIGQPRSAIFKIIRRRTSAPAPASGGVDAVAYRFWSISPKELDALEAELPAMPVKYPGGMRAWFYACEIQKLLDGAVAQRKEHAEPDEGRQDAGSTPAGASLSPAATPVSEAGGEADRARKIIHEHVGQAASAATSGLSVDDLEGIADDLFDALFRREARNA